MIHYLAIHDFVWINTTVTGRTLKFDYEALEECMAAQYSYGDSTRVQEQAAFMVDKLLTRRPFEFGNMRTAAIALMAFLTANKFSVRGEDARIAACLRDVFNGRLPALQCVDDFAEPTDLAMRPGVTLRTLVTYLINERQGVLRLLIDGDE